MIFRNVTLRIILDSILKTDSLAYSVIDEFIIISREIPPPTPSVADSAAVPGLKVISGIVIDGESSDPLPYATIGLKNAGRGQFQTIMVNSDLKFPRIITMIQFQFPTLVSLEGRSL